MTPAQLQREVWVECRCGKVRQIILRETSERALDGLERLHRVTACRSCGADAAIAFDRCPQSVVTVDEKGRGVSACRFGWHHAGRCEPDMTPADLARITEDAR